jgi:hypothetical protein
MTRHRRMPVEQRAMGIEDHGAGRATPTSPLMKSLFS